MTKGQRERNENGDATESRSFSLDYESLATSRVPQNIRKQRLPLFYFFSIRTKKELA